MSTARRLTSAMCAVALIAFAVIVWQHASRYFFIFDDFGLIHLSRTFTARQMLTEPLIGSYRPLAFLFLRAETFLFTWEHPAAYLAVILILHVANAALCAWLMRLLAPETPAAAPIAFVLLIASPWATEAFLWATGLFDVLATLGMLLTLVGVRLVVQRDAGRVRGGGLRSGAGIAMAFAGAALGAFSKENAVVIPALAVAAVLIDRPIKSLLADRKTLAAIVASAAPVAVYLILRQGILGVLDGAYGDFGTLWRNASIPKNLFGYVRAFAWVPMRSAWAPYAMEWSHVLRWIFALAVLPAVLVLLAMRRPRFATVCVIGFLIATLPVSWFGLMPDSTVAGRYVYLPAVWGVMLLSAALAQTQIQAQIQAQMNLRAWAAAAALGIALVNAGSSLAYQADVWSSATRLSRGALTQLAPYRDRHDVALDIQNLPFMFAEGPYVLKAYAFKFYYGVQSFPPVKGRAWVVKYAWNSQAVAPMYVDPSSDYIDRPPAGLTEQTIKLKFTP